MVVVGLVGLMFPLVKAAADGPINGIGSLIFKIKRPDVYKPLVLMLVLMFTQQFSGVATLTYYAVSIMEHSGSSLDKYTATIIYGVIRLMGSSLGALMMRR